MIAYLAGTLVAKKPTAVLIDVGGLGYRVHIPTSTFEALPDTGASVKLHTSLQVREDSQTLYGFATEGEQQTFEVMLGVSGIGPKLGLAALSSMRPAELRDYVVSGETALLTNIPGVGKKTADRLVLELKDRLADLELDGAGAPLSGGTEARQTARADALAALQELGFSRAAAERGIRKVLRKDGTVQDAEALIRGVLREQG